MLRFVHMRLALLVLSAASIAHAGGMSQHGAGASFDPASTYKVPRGAAPSEGPADAPVTIVVWSDYTCGYCNRVQDTLDRLKRLYPGQIRWVHRTLLLDDDSSMPAQAALAAAAQGAFAPMHARMFALHGRADRGAVELIARELGLDMLRFRADLDAGTYRKALADDADDARALGITGTPMFFINGRPIDGAKPLRAFAEVVDAELARAATLRAQHPDDLYEAAVGIGKPAADAAEPAPDPAELDRNLLYRVGLGLPGQTQGPDGAIVTIVEFSDFQCPFCAKQAPALDKLRQRYGDKLRIVFRHFPVLFHRQSVIAAEAGAAAAEQGKFWAFHDQVFGHFGNLTRADLEAYAAAAGLDLPKFRAALDERRFHDAVIAEGAAAEALGVTATPTLFLNGTPLVGMHDEELLSKLIDANLDRAQTAFARGLPRTDVYALVMSMAQGEDRADPSAFPDSSVMHVELRDDDRARAVAAACRRRDGTRARALAARLSGEAGQRVRVVCEAEGIDLVP